MEIMSALGGSGRKDEKMTARVKMTNVVSSNTCENLKDLERALELKPNLGG
jgi:hypothetical protein